MSVDLQQAQFATPAASRVRLIATQVLVALRCLSDKRTAALRTEGGSSTISFASTLLYGNWLPDFDFTRLMSEALIVPLTAMSARKLVPSITAAPAFDLTKAMSPEFTLLLPVPAESPTSTIIGTGMSPLLVPSDTFVNVSPICCWVATPVRSTTTVDPTIVIALTEPVPVSVASPGTGTACPFTLAIGLAKLTTT